MTVFYISKFDISKCTKSRLKKYIYNSIVKPSFRQSIKRFIFKVPCWFARVFICTSMLDFGIVSVFEMYFLNRSKDILLSGKAFIWLVFIPSFYNTN